MNCPGLSESVASIAEQPLECPLCGTDARITGGLCLGCLLRAGLDEAVETEDCDDALSQIEIRDTDWRLGNYQILEEIGRGGMGVIYRARQRHSKRIVALKRVLSYHGGSRETLERFRREAEAAASLDHPNILPIYEVSECEGLPFFTMKYATGGSLQQAAPALRAEPRESVRLLAKIARAVAYAHREGILHRDLKPGNILLDARGEPMVTDFGLAKWIDASTNLTRSLTVFGTPGYIAPEQAEGPAAALTPAADVYSLGAILFDLLTGRPPILGEHTLTVIRQAAEKPAPKLRLVLRNADRDLETICAKCLEREPLTRYRSAGHLAEDLERWLEGRPIVARPVSTPIEAWRWVKRNPKLAASAAASIILAGVGIAGWAASSRFEAIVHSAEVARRSVAVAPIEDLDALSHDSTLAIDTRKAVETWLQATRDIYVQPSAAGPNGNGTFSGAESWKTTEEAVKARLIVFGSVRKRAGNYRFTMRLLDTSTGKMVTTSLLDLPSIEACRQAVTLKVARWLEDTPSPTDQAAKIGDTANPEARSFYEQGKEFYYRSNFPNQQRAIDSFRKAIEFDANYAHAHAMLAIACQSRVSTDPYGDWDNQAITAADTALRLAPLLPEAHLARGDCLRRQGKIRASLDRYLSAYELDPANGQAAAMVGVTFDALGCPDLALRWLQRVQETETRPIYVEPLGHLWTALGEFEKAEAVYQTATKFRPDLPAGLLGLSRLALWRGDFSRARTLCSEAQSRYPHKPQPRMMAALIEFFSRNFSAAESLYREAAALDPGGDLESPGAVRSLSALGYCVGRKEGETEEAREFLRKARQLYEKEINGASEDSRLLYSFAATLAAQDELEVSMHVLRQAIAAGWWDYQSPRFDPRFDAMRGRADFNDVLNHLTEQTSERARFSGALRDTEGNPFNGNIDAMNPAEPASTTSHVTANANTGASSPYTPPPSGMVGWWGWEDNSEEIPGADTATLGGNAVLAPGFVGTALQLDGSAATYARADASVSLDVGAGLGLTIVAWINPSNLSTARPIVEWSTESNGAGSMGVHFHASASALGLGRHNLFANIVEKGTIALGTRGHTLSSGSGLLIENVYQHVAVTYHRASGNARLFVNGIAVPLNGTGESTVNIGSFRPNTAGNVYFGARITNENGDDGFRYIGEIDDVKIFNRALPASEIAAISNAGRKWKETLAP